MNHERLYLDALKAFAADPSSEAARRAVGVERLRFMELPARIERVCWPAAMRAAICLGDAIMDAKFNSVRSLSLAPIAGALADVISGDVGDIRAPSMPAAPVRQYRDD